MFVAGAVEGAPHALAGADGAVATVVVAGAPHALAGADGAAGAGVGVTATGAGAGATTVVRAGVVVVRRVVVVVRRVVVPVTGMSGATGVIAGCETGITAAGELGAIITGVGAATGCGATVSAIACPPVRRPELCCDALPETEMKPPALATLQLNESEMVSPDIVPLPDRSVKFIRMLRTESVKVQCWPEPKEIDESPERFALRVQCSPISLVTWIDASEREPGLISRRSRVERSSVTVIGEVTETVVFDEMEKLPAKGPGPRPCADAAPPKVSSERAMVARTHVRRFIVRMVR